MNSVELAKVCRLDVLKMKEEKKVGYIGSDYSSMDILAVLYSDIMKLTEAEETSDSLILSKGHAAAAWYAIMANTGLINHDSLSEYNECGYNMGAHPKRHSQPTIKTSTGSLGQGLGLACGIALADRLQKKDTNTYVILGDGECNEGSVWEAFMFGARYGLTNLTAIIDRNGFQSYGSDAQVMNLGNLQQKLEDFGWQAVSVDGHDHKALRDALRSRHNSKPNAIIANTVKGKGVLEFENDVIWHYKWPEGELYERAKEELMR